MKKLILFLSLIFFTVAGYSQQNGKFKKLEVTQSFELNDRLVDSIINNLNTTVDSLSIPTALAVKNFITTYGAEDTRIDTFRVSVDTVVLYLRQSSDDAIIDSLTFLTSADGDDLGDHTATQNLNMDGFRITNLPTTPSAGNDATSKTYVDGLDALNVHTTDDFAGDVQGTYDATSVTRIQGDSIAPTAPADNEILKWNTSAGRYEPEADVDFKVDSARVYGTPDTVVLYQKNYAGTITDSIVIALTASGGGGGFTQEEIEDFVGAMVTGNTETGITVTYQDGDGTIDFVVSVSSSEIVDGTIATADIADDAITQAKIADNAIGIDQMQDNAIGSAEIATNAVGSSEISTGAVDTDELAADAVTTAKIENGTILFADWAQNGATSGQVPKWNGSAWAAANDDSAAGGTDDQVIDTFEIVSNVLRLSLEDDAEVFKSVDLSPYLDNTNLSQEQVEDFAGAMWTGNTETLIDITYQDADGTIDAVVNDDLSLYDNTTSGFITGNETITLFDVTGSGTTAITTTIATGAVTSAKILDGTIATGDIADDAITVAKIAQNGATSGQVLKWNGTDWAAADDNDSGGGGTDDQTIALNNTALSIESGNTVYLDTLLDRSVAAPNAFGSSFADYFAQIYFSSTDYDEINTVPADRMTIDSINTTLDFFKVSWDGFDTILYNVEVRDTFSWMINSGAVAKTAKLDSIDLVNHRFYYTMKNGSEFALNDTVEFYNLYASYEMLSTDGTTEKILEVGITDGVTTIGGNTIDWYGTGAVLKKNDGSLVNMMHVEYSAGETGERDIIIATSDDMNEWTWDGTVWRDNDEVGWMTCTDVLLTDVDRIPNGYYAGKYICTGSAIASGDEDPFYFIINEALDTVVGFRERVPDGFVSSTALRPLSVEYFNNAWHEMFIEVKSSPRLNSLLIHAQYATIDDFIAGNHFQIDTITSGADQPSYGFNNGYFDSGTFYAEGGSLSFLYGIQPYDEVTGQTRLYYRNRSFGIMDWNGATWDFNPLGPLVSAGIGYNLLDSDWDNNNDHLGGYPSFVKWGDDLYLFMTAKGNNTGTEYYKAVIARLWNKTSAGGVDSWDIKDGTIKEEDLATAVTTKLNLQGVITDFAPTTTLTWDLDNKISGAAHIDCTSVSSGVTLTVSNPNTTYASYYTLYFYNVSGTDGITFPTGWIGEDGTALGTVNITADKYYACQYIGIDASNLYLCK